MSRGKEGPEGPASSQEAAVGLKADRAAVGAVWPQATDTQSRKHEPSGDRSEGTASPLDL